MTARVTPVILIVLAGLVGCATEQGEIGKPFSPSGRKELKINRTTRAEARSFLGEPRTIAPGPDGRATWRYEHSRISALSLPLIGGIRATQTPHVLMTSFVGPFVVGSAQTRLRHRGSSMPSLRRPAPDRGRPHPWGDPRPAA